MKKINTPNGYQIVLIIDLRIGLMAKYEKKAQEKVGEVMYEMKEGKLKTGTGKKVKVVNKL